MLKVANILVLLLLLLLLGYYLLSPLCRVFTIVYLKQTMFPGYILVLQLLCGYNVGHVILFSMLHVLYFYIITFRSTCAVPSMAEFYSSFISFFSVMLLK
jgi:hypothetical protein